MHRRMLLSAIGSNGLINLELEGSLASITTNAQLATFLGVPLIKVRYFTNTGSLIQASIRGNYAVPAGQFEGNTTLTKFRDVGGVIETVENRGFRNTKLTELILPKLKYVYGSGSIGYNTLLTTINLPSLTLFGVQMFNSNTAATEIYALNLEEIGNVTTTGSNNLSGLSSLNILDLRKLKVYNNPATGYGATAAGFNNLKSGCEIRVHIALATANNGAVNESLRYAKNVRGAVVKFYDDNGNYISTL